MKVEVLGPGCPKCQQLYQRMKLAINQLGVDCELVKVEDINAIVAAGVMLTPALIVDGEVKFSGKLPDVDELKGYLE